MYNYSGVIFRIWGVSGIIFLLGIVIILLEKPWKKKTKISDYKLGLIMVAFSIGLSLFYVSRIVYPKVSSYTGEFIEAHRDPREAPPLPVTYKYVFWNGEGKKKVVYLDIYSKKVSIQ